MNGSKIIQRHLNCVVFIFNRSIKSQFQVSLEKQMKIFNQEKQFRKVLDLFDLHKNNLSTDFSNMIISQVLKACTQLGDLRHGTDIHRRFSSHIKDDPYIVTSLIHMYMQCGKIKTAESLFSQCPTKETPMYGAMMKGYITQKMYKQAIDLFRQVKNPSDITKLLLFNACAQLKSKEALDLVKEVSSNLPKSFYSNSRFSTSLLDALMKCGDIHSAESIFIQCQMKTSSMYNAMMKGYIKHEMFEKVIDYFQEIKPIDEVNVVLLFKACSHLKTKEALDIVKKVSSTMPQSFYCNAYVLTSLIHVLMKFGDMETAETLFKQAKIKDLPMQSAMMKGYVTNQMFKKAIDLYLQIPNPDQVNAVIFFNACAQLKTQEALDMVKATAAKMPKSFYSDPHVMTSLIDALMKSGDMETAETLFKQAKIKDLPMQSAMMKGYINHEMFEKVIDYFQEIKPIDEVNVVLLFKACSHLKTKEALDIVKKVSSTMPQSFYCNAYVLTSLIHVLMKFGDMETAETLFKQAKIKDLPMQSAMMKGYVTNQMFKKAIDLYLQIPNPDQVNAVIFFNACAQLKTQEASDMVKATAAKMPKSFYSDPHVMTSLIDALMKCGDMETAETLFKQATIKVLPMHNAMMKGYVTNQMFKKAIDLYLQIPNPNQVNAVIFFNACAQLKTKEVLDMVKATVTKMPKSFYSDPHVMTSLIDALIECDDIEMAESLLNQTTITDVTVFGVMISGYVRNDNPIQAIQLFQKIKQKGLLLPDDHHETNKEIIISNEIFYLSVIDALVDFGDLSTSESIVKQIPRSFLAHPQVQGALTHMWGKIGSVDKAEEIFHKSQQVNQYRYNTMINAYGLNGRGKQAVDLYHRMPQEYIDEITHVCVLNACSHAGLVDDARQIFDNISHPTAKIITTMVDCLSRGGLLNEAKQMIDQFEETSAPSVTMHMTLLSGCRNYKNSRLAEEVYNRMIKHFPTEKHSMVAATVLMANTAALSGDMNKASRVRKQLEQSNVKKIVGLSWTTVNGKFYRFCAQDQSHPRSSEIYAEVNRMSDELIQLGYKHDASWITKPLKPGETIASVLCGHSERLAIAWNFVENPKTTRIQVTKNLRVCGNCHTATKLIASARQCDIIVRDANRIHHFRKDGTCSCNDYF